MKKLNKIKIIAEIGVNHNGSLSLAKKLIDVAVKANADFVKFQSFKSDLISTQNAKKTFYQSKSIKKYSNQLEMLKDLELTEENHIKLLKYCEKKNIIFLSTPFDIESIKFLNKIKLKYLKIASGEITNLPYLIEIGKLNKKIFLSTGMSNIYEIQTAINILEDNGTKKQNITLLHCNTEYPTPIEDANLKAMLTMKKKFNLKIGLSDHTIGFLVPIAAATLGASVIEKHITLNKNLPGPDHSSSMEPNDFYHMVRLIKNIPIILGDGKKKPTKSEKKNINFIRKSIVAINSIKKGEKYNIQNIGIKRPGNGISPMKFFEIIGLKSHRNYKIGDLIVK